MRLSNSDLILFRSHLQLLAKSCVEGYTGEWDSSTDEGKKSFISMLYLIQDIEHVLGLPYSVSHPEKIEKK